MHQSGLYSKVKYAFPKSNRWSYMTEWSLSLGWITKIMVFNGWGFLRQVVLYTWFESAINLTLCRQRLRFSCWYLQVVHVALTGFLLVLTSSACAPYSFLVGTYNLWINLLQLSCWYLQVIIFVCRIRLTLGWTAWKTHQTYLKCTLKPQFDSTHVMTFRFRQT